jgi:mono/diheme cytochrome c family protein
MTPRVRGRLAGAGLCLGALVAGCGPPPGEGKQLFATYCSACHQIDGGGTTGGAPPLVRSPWVLGSDARLIRIVLHGVRGEIEVGGVVYQLEMPGFGSILADAQVADVLSHVRKTYGGADQPIPAAAVRRVREQSAGRQAYWTVEELLRIE